MTTKRTMVVCGAGLAGASAVRVLREEGYDGRLILLGDEPDPPYDRPPLTKGYLRAEQDRNEVFLQDRSWYDSSEVELSTGTPVARLDAAERRVVTASGRSIPFTSLLLATGSAPRRLDTLPGAGLAGIHYLRSLADADVLRRRLRESGRMVVVGAGWIGLEVAASARQLGWDVTVVDPAPAPLVSALGRRVGQVFQGFHEDHGVSFQLGTGVAGFSGGDAGVEAVSTSDGSRLSADVVVVGVGVHPRVELARQAGLAVADGVLVDEHLRTSHPDIYAAGDIARIRHPFYDRDIRVEHWAVARSQGEAAAGSMLGRQAPYDDLPFFFSDQYDVGMEYRGSGSATDDVVFRGDPAEGPFVAFWLRDDRVTAVMNVNEWDVGSAAETLLRSGVQVDRRRLIDSEVSLEDFALAMERKASYADR